MGIFKKILGNLLDLITLGFYSRYKKLKESNVFLREENRKLREVIKKLREENEELEKELREIKEKNKEELEKLIEKADIVEDEEIEDKEFLVSIESYEGGEWQNDELVLTYDEYKELEDILEKGDYDNLYYYLKGFIGSRLPKKIILEDGRTFEF